MAIKAEETKMIRALKKNIREYRERNNLTQTQLGEILETGRTTYTKWESGNTIPNAIQLANLARIYGTDVTSLLKQDDPLAVHTDLPIENDIDPYLSTLSNKERVLIAKLRLLNEGDIEKVNKYIDKIKKD